MYYKLSLGFPGISGKGSARGWHMCVETEF
jgi:hypothetical protein